MTRVLILGGTMEGARLAEAISAKTEIEAIYSLAGVTRSPNRPDCQVRTGGFGGVNGLAEFLRKEKIDKVVDATHPYAARMAAHAAEVCDQENIPRLKLLRPTWVPMPEDDWRVASDAVEAVKLLRELTDRVFLATGRKNLAAFATLTNIWFLVRLVDAPSEGIPLTDYQLVLGRGPFNLDAEKEMLRHHRIGAVISKNSGGGAYAKIEAARELSLPVVMINRPQAPKGRIVETMDAVMGWL